MLALGVVLGLVGSRMLSAQDGLKSGTVLKRTELKGAPGWEAILVQREVPPGAESGKHTQGGNEIVYIQEGSVTLEVQGKPAVNLKAGEAFTTSAGEVHNVKNASQSAPVKALAFYVAKKGAGLEDLAVPAK
jgi:quercetin dioxygenase-like cupin family protein